LDECSTVGFYVEGVVWLDDRNAIGFLREGRLFFVFCGRILISAAVSVPYKAKRILPVRRDERAVI
jgi:hypothetical protein